MNPEESLQQIMDAKTNQEVAKLYDRWSNIQFLQI